MQSRMARRKSTHNDVREKRLKRKKVILTIWGCIASFFNWLKCVVTFKKCIVIFCIYYVVQFVEYLKVQNELGNYFSDTVAVAIITAFLVELGLTALSSHRQGKNNYDDDDINYG